MFRVSFFLLAHNFFRYIYIKFEPFSVVQVGLEVAHPGVANDFGDESAKKYYTYYQWVCFALFFQVSISENDFLTMYFGICKSENSQINTQGENVFGQFFLVQILSYRNILFLSINQSLQFSLFMS